MGCSACAFRLESLAGVSGIGLVEGQRWLALASSSLRCRAVSATAVCCGPLSFSGFRAFRLLGLLFQQARRSLFCCRAWWRSQRRDGGVANWWRRSPPSVALGDVCLRGFASRGLFVTRFCLSGRCRGHWGCREGVGFSFGTCGRVGRWWRRVGSGSFAFARATPKRRLAWVLFHAGFGILSESLEGMIRHGTVVDG